MELPKYWYIVPKVSYNSDGLTVTFEDQSDKDVVEVVRCQRCIYARRSKDGEATSCRLLGGNRSAPNLGNKDFFCAFGKEHANDPICGYGGKH